MKKLLIDAEALAAYDDDVRRANDDTEYGSVIMLDCVADAARYVIVTDESQENVYLYVFTEATADHTIMYSCDSAFEALDYVHSHSSVENMIIN